ncbi:MAG: hypothetical protein IKB07_08390 [Lachnospiraceae bacterium]|nr:hypothetical protein [Lachnospiraceae bacterium]
MGYEDLLIEAEKENLIVKEKPLQAHDGRIKGNRIAIRKDIPTLAEKACVLAEEIGHYKTTVGDILHQDDVCDKKQENAARLWAYNRLVGLRGIIDGFLHGCRNRAELAEYLGVTESFLQNAIDCYKRKYGLCVTVDNYVIYFEPALAVLMV